MANTTAEKEDLTRAETGPVSLERGYALMEPFSWDDDDNDSKKTKPQYMAGADFDKDKDADIISMLLDAQDAAINNAIDKEIWDEDVSAKLSFVDADMKKVQKSKDDKTKVRMSEKNPFLKNRYHLKTSNPRRPDVRYLVVKPGVDGKPKLDYVPMPFPEKGMSEKRVQEIKDFWDTMVYPGQNVNLGVTFYAWSVADGQGVKAILDSVLILGGGERYGNSVSFEDHFGSDVMDTMLKWVEENTDYELPEVGTEDDSVDEETGEIEETPVRRTRKNRKTVEEDAEEVTPTHRRSATRKTKQVEEPEETESEVEDDEPEEKPVRRRSTSRRTTTRKVTRRHEASENAYDDEDEAL